MSALLIAALLRLSIPVSEAAEPLLRVEVQRGGRSFVQGPNTPIEDGDQVAFSRARGEVIRTTRGIQRPANVNYLERPLILVPLPPGERREVDPDELLGVVTVLVAPDGPVTLGCVPGIDDGNGLYCDSNESLIQVQVAPLRMMRCTVDQALWDRVARDSAGLRSVAEHFTDKNTVGATLPMVFISWLDCVLFANAATDWCNQRGASLRRAFKLRRDNKGTVIGVDWVQGADGWRLHTEDEWETAARLSSGPVRTQFAGGINSLEELKKRANIDQQDGVKYLAPADSGNQGGFRHLTGNVGQWCWDRNDDRRAGRAELHADLQRAPDRVLRGGYWANSPRLARVACRHGYVATIRWNDAGLRLVRSIP